MKNGNWNRREVLAAGAVIGAFPGALLAEGRETMISKPIPSTGEMLPVVGLGTYQVFDVPSTPDEIASRTDIVDLLIKRGGKLIDTSPMYQRSEKVIGAIIKAGVDRRDLFLATKVWTNGVLAGIQQMEQSAELMNTRVIDLMQVHNLRDTAVHMETIRDWQAEGRIRYSGLTHYTASAHNAMQDAMQEFSPQFIQINYSLGERGAEQSVLPLAQDLGIAVLINRPFQAGALFRKVGKRPIPDFAKPYAATWGQYFLKFIISHPAVTCVIPATSKVSHMTDNLGAGFGLMPDAAMRKRMADYFASL